MPTTGSFLLMFEHLCLQLCFGAFLLAFGAILVTIGAFLLTIAAFLLTIEAKSASDKHLKGVQAKETQP